MFRFSGRLGSICAKSIRMFQSKHTEVERTSDKLLVAAIDFGTTFSGWSFLFGHQYGSDPTKVCAKNWNNGTNISSKTPTAILIAPDGKTVEKFGYEAEDQYATLASENKHKEHYYFRRFKLKLYNKLVLNRTIDLDDENGRQLPALTVFSLSIKYTRDNLLQECNRQIVDGGVDKDGIHWVITVPAIWNDAAKQFMREAAEMAGIKAHKLTIALEPEAASIFCKHIAVEKHVSAEGLSIDTFSPGSRYIVLDAGGGTVDITIHEVLPNDQLKELHNASGGAWGGSSVDEQFYQFLIKIFGAPIMKKFKTAHMDDYLDIVRDFEVKKRGVSFEEKATFIRLPATLMALFEEETGEELKSTIGQMNFIGEVTLQTGNKLRVDAACLRSFFGPAIKGTLDHLDELIKEPAASGVDILLMVGGFSESVFLQEKIRRKFPQLKVIVPPETGLVVLKGAAIFGHSDNAISERVSKYTYGFTGYRQFLEGSDPEEYAVIDQDRGKRLKRAFLKLVEKGEAIQVNERREWDKNRVAHGEEPFINFPLFGSHQKDPVGEWSADTFRIGILRVQIQNMAVPRNERKFRIAGIFGKTEIELQAVELSIGKLTSVTFDALL